MSLKGKAAIVGIGELQPMKMPPKRTGMGLIAEAAYRAIHDAGLTKGDIDGIMGEPPDGDVGDGYPEMLTQYLKIFPCACNTVGTPRRQFRRDGVACGGRYRCWAMYQCPLCAGYGDCATQRERTEHNARQPGNVN